MWRFLLAFLIACAQLMLQDGRLYGSTHGAGSAKQDYIPPVVEQESDAEYRIGLGLLRVDEDVLLVGGSDYMGTRPQSPKTRYPIVMLHGFLGWDQIFYLDYFYHIRRELEADGFQVYAPRVTAVASIATRGRQPIPLFEQILRETGAEKVNIIAHSMGGLDARWLIGHGFADRIASLTTIGTPHHGTPVPNMVFKVIGTQSNFLYKAFEYIVSGVMAIGGGVKPSQMDVRENLWNLSSEFMEDYFNLWYLDDPNIYYQSFGGVSSMTGAKTGDRLDPLLYAFQASFKWGERNDGLVPENSAKWGRFRGYVSADHINLIGQLFGRTSQRFDHLKFYKKIAWELVDLGF